MKANEIQVGGYYWAKVGLNVTVVRVDEIRERTAHGQRIQTVYDVTNTKSGRSTTFRSAAKFRSKATNPNAIPVAQPAKPMLTGVTVIEEMPDGAPVKSTLGNIVNDIIAQDEYTVDEDGNEVTEDEQRVPFSVSSSVGASQQNTQPNSLTPASPAPALLVANTDVVPANEEDEQRIPFVVPSPNTQPNVAALAPATVKSAISTVSTLVPSASSNHTSNSTGRIGGLAGQLTRSATTTAPHVQLKALAGSGKTTSCIEGLKVVKGVQSNIKPSPQQEVFWEQMKLGRSDTVRVSAFNTTITDEMKSRLAETGLDRRGCEARGVHSLGLQSVTKMFGRVEASKWTVLDLTAQVLGRDFNDLKKQPGMLTMLNAVDDLVSLCKQNLTEPTLENLEQLTSHYDIETDGKIARIADVVPQVIERCKQPNGRIHFDDMVWLPLVLELPVQRVDVQIIDEAQDLSRMQQELVYRGGHRIIAVGDEFQAIYGFSGADSESMKRMEQHLKSSKNGCVQLPLTVTRRCGKAIVDEARQIVPMFEAHADNPTGIVRDMKYPIQRDRDNGMKELPWEQTYCKDVKDGAMILCRVNAPLVSQCFRFLKRKIKANILGRKIGDGLVSLVEKSKALTVDELRGWLGDWLSKEQESERKKKFSSEARMIALQDRHDCVMCFANNNTYAADVIANIKSVFTDSKDTRGIRLASIHKSKGLESDQVFLLMPKGGECPHPMAKSEWQRQQEMNLKYVAITRAIHELVYVT